MDNRKNITQPADWWAAFESAAKAEGKTLSEWIGDVARKSLGKAGKQLSERKPAHRPKKILKNCVGRY